VVWTLQNDDQLFFRLIRLVGNFVQADPLPLLSVINNPLMLWGWVTGSHPPRKKVPLPLFSKFLYWLTMSNLSNSRRIGWLIQQKIQTVVLLRYLESVETAQKIKQATGKPLKKVISMSLWGGKSRYTYGALRNVQLLPVYFPGWILRFYVERPRYDDTTVYAPVPPRILSKLSAMGAEMVYVDAERSHIPPMMWRFLISDDMTVDVFIVRDSDCRLNDRDFAVVSEWLRTDYAFHCIRDHPSHAGYSLSGGLWGARPRQLRSFVSIPWSDMMMGYRTAYIQDMQFLANAIWPLVQSRAAYCHDSVSCLNWPASHPFPVARIGTEHLGQVFDAFGNARDEDLHLLLEHRPIPQCTIPSNSAPRKTKPINETRDSSSDILKNDKHPDNFALTTPPPKGERHLNRDTADTIVWQQLKNTSSNAVRDVLPRNTTVEKPSLKPLTLPHANDRQTPPSSSSLHTHSVDNRVQNVPSGVHVNSSFIISDGSWWIGHRSYCIVSQVFPHCSVSVCCNFCRYVAYSLEPMEWMRSFSKSDKSKLIRAKCSAFSIKSDLLWHILATPICAARRRRCLFSLLIFMMSTVFTCKRGSGLRHSARWEPDDHAHYDQKDLRVLFHWTGSILSDKSRLI